MKRLTVVLAVTLYPATAAPTLDGLYDDVLVALKRQCSESYPDMKPSIDQAIQEYISANSDLLSPDYLKRIELRHPDQRTYTREQCVGMSKLPKAPMKELSKQHAQELEEVNFQRRYAEAIRDLKRRGIAKRASLGVEILTDGFEAKVREVEEASSAAEAGIMKGDVITSYDGKQIGRWTDLVLAVLGTVPDKSVKIQLLRAGKAVSLRVKPKQVPIEIDNSPEEIGRIIEEAQSKTKPNARRD
jgi:C-terminal processing protease CtpA/Prc